MIQAFSEQLEPMLETYRVGSKWSKIVSFWWLQAMCALADQYYNGSKDRYNAQSTLLALLKQYEKSDRQGRQRLLADFSKIVYYADLYCVQQAPSGLNTEEALEQAFLSLSLSMLKLYCVCCGRFMEKEQFFCLPCSCHKDRRKVRRVIAHLWRRLS